MEAIERGDDVIEAGLFAEMLAKPLTALVYDDGFGIGEVFGAIAASAINAGLRLGGVIEKPVAPVTPRRHCDMVLEELATGQKVKISEDRGALARGCRLDLDSLTQTCALVLATLPQCDLVLLNKFGKTEAEGGGFRCVVSHALGLETPVIIGVPRRNLEAWRDFAGDFAIEVEAGSALVVLQQA